jgi:hypothetical protein
MASQLEVSTSDADNNSGSEEADLSREVAGWNLSQDKSSSWLRFLLLFIRRSQQILRYNLELN